MLKMKKKAITYEYVCIYLTVFASSGKLISSSLLFRLVLIQFIFFSSERKTDNDIKGEKKCQKKKTTTTVTSLSRRHMMRRPVIRMVRDAVGYQERKNHYVYDCHAPLC